MSAGTSSDAPGGDVHRLSVWQRTLLRLPRLGRDGRSLGERLRSAMLKPPDPGKPAPAPRERTLEELELAEKTADDRERLIGLVAAPLAAGLGFLVVHTLVVNDPPAHLASGAPDKLYVNPSVYDDLFLVLLALSLGMLVTALMRKRLYLGMITALYGLAVFNLHYWGFGVPFVMVGAWYLVRAYRAHRSLKEAGAEAGTAGRPSASRRYTPPSAVPKRLTSARPRRERRAG